MDPVSELKIIARIRSDFPSKFGIPRQSGLVEELKAELVFEPEYRNPEALRGIEGFSHIWLIWLFSEAVRASWSPTVRPPRLGGNTRMGVFATRSPFRPNPIGLSAVRRRVCRAKNRRAPQSGSFATTVGASAKGAQTGAAGCVGAGSAAVVSYRSPESLRHGICRARGEIQRAE